MSFPCQYINAKGECCETPALFRLHFSLEHPFDFVHVCEEHKKYYRYYAWFEDLNGREEAT